MMSNEEMNNQALVRGRVLTPPTFSHEVFGEGFFELEVSSQRLSNQFDVIPITISERILEEHKLNVGDDVTFYGQFRSYNKLSQNKSRLLLTLFVREIVEQKDENNPNIISVCGFLCKPCIYRTTPFNREIADILVAVNRSYNKSDYLPCIAWGRNARFCKTLAVGDKIALTGRIQSRKYIKKFDETLVEEKTAYEISISKFAIGDNVEKLIDENIEFFKWQNVNPLKEYDDGVNAIHSE
ncbi:MAG: single-stranded DNA-binding protein, partial [Clostridia bacterium]